ncbi:MAG: molybdenum cofactor biosynthesis protein MoaE [Actinobacteria bacterium]|nr:molybdenum cofactor biosynthesis protein MoaE [Actinomycetota bacterium]
MRVQVRLFALLRERAGRASVEVDLEEGASVADALRELTAIPGLAEPIERMPVLMAVNREYAAAHTRLAADDELALIPPVSGGAGARVSVTEDPLDPRAVEGAVGHPGAGAIVCFQGVTREVPQLDYEAYREMAERRIAEVLDDCVARHGLLRAAAQHRVGVVPLGEPAVVVAVSAPHRGEAFSGAREAIDRMKAEAPIWKREVEADGSERWVEAPSDPGLEDA